MRVDHGIAGLLTVDCGNSTVDCLHHADGARLRLDTHAADLEELASWLRGRDVSRCVLASVVASASDRLYAILRRSVPCIERAGFDLPCPLRLAYAVPGSLGVDRWLGAFAAHRRHSRAVVVDCGTATTVNLVDADGWFLGGCIAPGLRAFVAGMAAVTPALPAARIDSVPQLPASDTQSAVDAGVLFGYCGMVERLVADSLRGFGPAKVVLTGGNATVLKRLTRLQGEVESDLVHEGMRLLAAERPCAS